MIVADTLHDLVRHLEDCFLVRTTWPVEAASDVKTADGLEVDFQGRSAGGKPTLNQVAAELDDTQTREREIRAVSGPAKASGPQEALMLQKPQNLAHPRCLHTPRFPAKPPG